MDSQPASATRYTEILTQFIENLHLPSVVLPGNSIGGAVSIRYASLHPERVKAIVLCDSGGLGVLRTILRSRQPRSFLVSLGLRPLLPESSAETCCTGRKRPDHSFRVRDCSYSGASVAKFCRPEENLAALLPQFAARFSWHGPKTTSLCP